MLLIKETGKSLSKRKLQDALVQKYKSKWAGKNVLTIDRFAPSSKTCSHCNERKLSLTLAERSFVSENCDIEIDFDINAAINIKNFALKKIGQELPKSKPVNHALAGDISDILATHGIKQVAAIIGSA